VLLIVLYVLVVVVVFSCSFVFHLRFCLCCFVRAIPCDKVMIKDARCHCIFGLIFCFLTGMNNGACVVPNVVVLL
jgi:hypothetical protein